MVTAVAGVRRWLVVACVALPSLGGCIARSGTLGAGGDPAVLVLDAPVAWRLERVLERGWVLDDPGAPVPGPHERVTLREPFALGAGEAEIYVADRVLGATFRYDLGLDVLEPLPRAAECARAAACVLAAAADRRLYFARVPGPGVVSLDWTGEALRFPGYVAPVGIAALAVDSRGDVRVLDLAAAREYRHSRDGVVLGERELVPPPPPRALAARAPGGWWIVDAAAGTVAFHDADGVRRTEPRRLAVAAPVAIAADERGALFVADAQAVYAITATGAEALADADGRPRRFVRVTALAAARGRLYVACAAPARVEVWRAGAAQ